MATAAYSADRSPSTSEMALASMAILTTNFERDRRTYIDYFVPFVADCVASAETASTTVSEVRVQLRECWGMDIPTSAVETILRRCKKLKLVDRTRDVITQGTAAGRVAEIRADRADSLRRIEELLTKLEEFAFSTYGKRLPRERVEAALFSYVEERSTPILKAMVSQDVLALAPPADAAETAYIVGAFIMDLAEKDATGFATLESIVKGSMLATVLYLPNPAEADHRFEDLAAYVDTPFLIDALGYRGDEVEAASREIIELLLRSSVRVLCFERTAHELRGVLGAVAAEMRWQGRGTQRHSRPLAPWFIQKGLEPQDVARLADNIEDELRRIRVTIVDYPPPSRRGIDEKALENCLAQNLADQRPEARVHDVSSIAAVYRLRGGRRPYRLEKAAAIFVTTSGGLVGAVRKFFTREEYGDIPLAVTHHDLATLAWLKSPLASPLLPRKRIVADCYAALEPGSELWRAYVAEIDRLRKIGSISERDFFVARYSQEAKRALMQTTLGVPTKVSEDAVHEVLSRAKADWAAPYELRLSEREQETAVERRLREQAEAAVRAAEDRAEAAEARAASLLAAARQAEREDEATRRDRQHRARLRAKRDAGLLRIVVFVLLALPLAAIGWVSVFPPADDEVTLIARIALLLGAVVAAVGAITGHTLARFARYLQRRLTLVLERRYLREL